ncbi:MAG: V-type ATP synthase subunit E [Candidatus Bipolaricaulia bacterium]
MELLEQIEKAGEQEVQAILARAEAEAEAQRFVDEARNAVEAWERAHREQVGQELERERERILGEARARSHQAVSRAKQEVIDEIFAKLVDEVAQLRQATNRYKTFLKAALAEAEAEIGGPLRLQIDLRDRELIGELIQDMPHEIGDTPLETLGGFIATSQDEEIRLDNRLETRIENLKRTYLRELGRQLFKAD